MSVWTWVKDHGSALLAIERLIVTVAALAALFPLWQFWDEREDRHLDRAANFVQGLHACAVMGEKYPEIMIELREGEMLPRIKQASTDCIFLRQILNSEIPSLLLAAPDE